MPGERRDRGVRTPQRDHREAAEHHVVGELVVAAELHAGETALQSKDWSGRCRRNRRSSVAGVVADEHTAVDAGPAERRSRNHRGSFCWESPRKIGRSRRTDRQNKRDKRATDEPHTPFPFFKSFCATSAITLKLLVANKSSAEIPHRLCNRSDSQVRYSRTSSRLRCFRRLAYAA